MSMKEDFHQGFFNLILEEVESKRIGSIIDLLLEKFNLALKEKINAISDDNWIKLFEKFTQENTIKRIEELFNDTCTDPEKYHKCETSGMPVYDAVQDPTTKDSTGLNSIVHLYSRRIFLDG